MDVVGLIATLLLLGVTYWYARTTRDMAYTARRAAEESARATAAAERSAEAARDAAQVAQSQIDVDFDGRTISLAVSGREPIPTVELRSIGQAVVVQHVRVRRAFRAGLDGQLHDRPALTDAAMTAVGEIQLPRRLHRGERLHLTHPAMSGAGDAMRRFLLDVDYTFSEAGGAGGSRQVIVDER